MKRDKVIVIGAGAIGGFYGALLAKAGADVSVVCRSDYQTIKQQGYRINSSVLGQWTFKPTQIVNNVSDYTEKADYILLCTKVIPETNRAQLIEKAVKADTCIILIQNGIDIEQELIDAFPNNEIISGLAFICCNRVKHGEIHHLAYGKLTLGSVSHPSNKTQHICNLITLSGIEAGTSDNIITSRWLKCLWNAAFNPLSVLSSGLSTQKILSSQEPLIRTIMQEVCTIAKSYGHTLPEDSIDINISNTHHMPPYKTSMLLDYQKRQPMEIEAILGNTIRLAKKSGTACPTLETLYALMKLKEECKYPTNA